MIGTEVHGYQILDLLGEGGMGDVYKALDVELNRLVALKFIKAEFGDDKALIQRFRDELRVLANFNHPNITTLYTTFAWQGRPVMVMELVEGETLLNMVRRRGPIPAQVSVPLFRQALAGVGQAHRKNIVHRDLKPANLMLNTDGVVKVMDFGIAKMQNAQGHTKTGSAMGTCLYMSPEQIRGAADKRSDIYAMGVTLYELLAGRCPFLGESEYDIQTAHVTQIPDLPTHFYPHIPPAIVEAVMRSLAKKPDDRFQCAEDFSAALANLDPIPGGPQPHPTDTARETVRETIVHGRAATEPRPSPAYAVGVATPPPATAPQVETFTPPFVPPFTPQPQAGAQAFTPVPTTLPALDRTPIPEPEPATSPLDRVLRPLDPLLERWFGRTGRPRLVGASVAVAALLALGGSGYLLSVIVSPGPDNNNQVNNGNGSGGSGSGGAHSGGGSGGSGGSGGFGSSGGSGSGSGGSSGGGSIASGGGGSTDPFGGSGHSNPSKDDPFSGGGTADKKDTSGTKPASAVAGHWAGVYERCDNNARTAVTMDLNEPSPGSISGDITIRTGALVLRCTIDGIYMPQARSLSFSLPSCTNTNTPAYLRSPHRSLLHLSGNELTGDVEPQDSCVTARFTKM